jgi:hypothetical protein
VEEAKCVRFIDLLRQPGRDTAKRNRTKGTCEMTSMKSTKGGKAAAKTVKTPAKAAKTPAQAQPQTPAGDMITQVAIQNFKSDGSKAPGHAYRIAREFTSKFDGRPMYMLSLFHGKSKPFPIRQDYCTRLTESQVAARWPEGKTAQKLAAAQQQAPAAAAKVTQQQTPPATAANVGFTRAELLKDLREAGYSALDAMAAVKAAGL